LNPNAMVDGNTFVNPFANSSTSAAVASSSSSHFLLGFPMIMNVMEMITLTCGSIEHAYILSTIPHEFQWTKDHPLEQVIEEPSRLVLTRNQLRSDGDMCMYALTVSTMKPKNVKEAMTNPAWIDSMQDELLQFKRLDVWVLVPALDNISPLTLKWLFKNKHDKEQTVIRNKSHLVVRGYRQENLEKYGMESCDPIGTPIEIKDKLDQINMAKTTEKHLKEVKRIFRYLRGTVNTGLWYTKDSGFELTGFLDADYAG
nr:integrase, catalytic region, zinc finger, CCHC-type, peptidase aspartic, catalytic [Tanacetum cinerariifolium]